MAFPAGGNGLTPITAVVAFTRCQPRVTTGPSKVKGATSAGSVQASWFTLASRCCSGINPQFRPAEQVGFIVQLDLPDNGAVGIEPGLVDQVGLHCNGPGLGQLL